MCTCQSCGFALSLNALHEFHSSVSSWNKIRTNDGSSTWRVKVWRVSLRALSLPLHIFTPYILLWSMLNNSHHPFLRSLSICFVLYKTAYQPKIQVLLECAVFAFTTKNFHISTRLEWVSLLSLGWNFVIKIKWNLVAHFRSNLVKMLAFTGNVDFRQG